MSKPRKQPKNIEHKDFISVSITWVDGRIPLDPSKIQAQAFYGICHWSCGIWAVTPLDFIKPTLITSFLITPPMAKYSEPFCEKGHVCLDFKCPLNRFDPDLLVHEFKDCSLFSLGLPKSVLERKEQWFNTPKWKALWKEMRIMNRNGQSKGKYIIDVGIEEEDENIPTGGVLKFDKRKYEEMQK